VALVDRLCGLVVRVPGYRSRGPGFNFRCYQIFWEEVSLERSPLSLVSTIEEPLGRNNSGSGLENREYGRRYPLRWTSGGRSVGIVRLRTKATEYIVTQIVQKLPAVMEPEETLDLILREFNLVHAVNNISIVLSSWLARHLKFWSDHN
jgi:hypothetical protein